MSQLKTPVNNYQEYKDKFSFRFLVNSRQDRRQNPVRDHPPENLTYENDSLGSPRLHNRIADMHLRTNLGCNHPYCSKENRDFNSNISPCEPQMGAFCHEQGQRIDNSGYLLHKIACLYGDEDLSDIQISVGVKTFRAHKLVLCCSSDVFKVMLTNPSWPESQKNRITLKEEPQCIQVFEDFLKYLYTGVIHLNHYVVLPVLMLADKYNVIDLREVCIDFMCNHLVSVIRHNHSVSWLQYAYLCGHRRIAEVCYTFIKWNFHKVASTNDFFLMEKELLQDFLEDSNLVVPDEYAVFAGISRWLQHQEFKLLQHPLEFKLLVLELLSLIRFPMMSPKQLLSLENEALALAFSEFFTEKVGNALRYHSSTIEDRQIHFASISGESDHYEPRIYTNDTWSTSLSIDSFTALPLHDIRPLFFSSPLSGSEADDHNSWEWNVDLYPKGVQFQKCIMIGLWRNLEISGAVYNTVRLTIKAKTSDVRQVDVAVLVTGVQDNVEHIKQVFVKRCCFDRDSKMYNFDDIVPFEDLNCNNSSYLSGPDGNSFKVTIIVKPSFLNMKY